MRPRLLWIDEIWRKRRHSSPIVDTGIEQIGVMWIGKIWRRLNIHIRHQQPSYGYGAKHVFTIRLRRGCHQGAAVREELLHDYLLNMSILLVQVADRDQGVDPFFQRFADSDQDSSS